MEIRDTFPMELVVTGPVYVCESCGKRVPGEPQQLYKGRDGWEVTTWSSPVGWLSIDADVLLKMSSDRVSGMLCTDCLGDETKIQTTIQTLVQSVLRLKPRRS